MLYRFCLTIRELRFSDVSTTSVDQTTTRQASHGERKILDRRNGLLIPRDSLVE